MIKKRLYGRGFTLIELMVVISTIAMLASITMAPLAAAKESAQDAALLSDVHQLEIALTSYKLDHGDYPLVTNGSFDGQDYITAPLAVLKTEGYLSANFTGKITEGRYWHLCDGVQYCTVAGYPGFPINNLDIFAHCNLPDAKAAYWVMFNKTPSNFATYYGGYVTLICLN
jgi:prepilin-type N-terminal cleavage/methylation domain-containing protein